MTEDQAGARRLARETFAGAPRRLWLGFVPSPEALEPWREEASRLGYRLIERVLQRSPAVEICGPWGSYEASLGANLRADVRRRLRRLREAGTVTVDVADGSERLDELMAEGLAVEASGWKGTRRTAVVSRLETRQFYSAVGRWAAGRGWLRLGFLRLEGRPLAFHLDLEHRGVLYHLKGGYDPAYARFSPGKVLHHALLERAHEAGLARYEFLGGADPYKLRWANASREARLLQAFAPSMPGLVDWAAFAYGRPLARRAVQLR